MEIPSKYLPNSVEEKWYAYWLKYNFFHSTPDERTPYTIVIPPPNVTGILHMGHMLNNTIQDVLIRRARLKGFNACWVPGTDHASIATEAKVVAKLKEQGIDKANLTREEFLKHAWDWTHQYGGVILEQLKKLGCSCDWDRTKFTLDDDLYASVIKVFVDLYNKGYIYRGYRMVNWDPEAKTTLSDEEVIYKEQNGKLFYLKYYISSPNPSEGGELQDVQNKNSNPIAMEAPSPSERAGGEEYLLVATTRPETIFGDIAVCINPNDERYKHLKGKKVIVPIVNRVVPIIEDEYVDIEFGTGALKITPAHDKNDYEIGERHKLEIIDAFTDDAKLNHHGLYYEGKDRFVVRKEIVKELETKDLLLKTEDYLNKVGTSERTGAVIEQRPLDQWFLKMEDLVKPAISGVLESEEINFFPKRYENTYRHWMENIRDWNISRQLWWGQQIPAYYYGSGKEDFVVAETKEKALELAKAKSNNHSLTTNDLKQDEDALDTWFSSWLWPMSVFGGILDSENEEYNYYYPTSDLVTAPDIIFFWVARMIMAGYEFKGKKPFTNVYFTGLVRDKQGRKMSKSLGNSPDALKLIDDFGADGVRVGLLLSSAAGNDLLFDEALCQQGSGFANKIWNAFRLVKGWEISEANQPENNRIAIEWYRNKFQKVLGETEDDFAKYRISDALMKIYKLVWDDFCSWLLEMVKPAYGQPIDQKTFAEIIAIFEDNLKLLHPFMPFITEEIWQHITERKPEEALVVAKYPEITSFDERILAEFETAAEVISGVRTVRKEKNIPFKEEMPLSVLNNEQTATTFDVIIAKLGNLSELKYVSQKVEGAISFRVKSNEYFIPMQGNINVEEEIKKLEEELKYTQGFLASVEKKLSNEKFVSSAPEKVVEMERKKLSDALAKIETIQESLKNLRG
ncbi:valine--tRNA ligase [Capnocytophaga catalasegens]|uniref:Valine--tRNA ligase n=1 Tax=Capnocytophaga catalasegens TaxID=1004260 RepID=A0AAV5B0M4_9FLAO|nr:valine--tRNA ligase [Capnocytophaga catalasegens]GIZ16024.1 valine--tRNA ligase [Capnocytophaga catalasegens]GJM51677.1 valine--tRNA ligase [Capnocytophaga catalasegens]GJM53113.1 valine--tRNA ligase [Capnocytophaga catalasegens]